MVYVYIYLRMQQRNLQQKLLGSSAAPLRVGAALGNVDRVVIHLPVDVDADSNDAGNQCKSTSDTEDEDQCRVARRSESRKLWS
jgi:hypothetical protein